MKIEELPAVIDVKTLKSVFPSMGSNTIYMLVNDKEFPSFKVCRKWYIKKEALLKWLEK